ncbi:MAG TPA: MBL fold metallo-hydrolase [Xanthobacteraceae bacterium]|nr:MBL fold metallo-hydrolase [Xanthobacteraceae bacterium]
MTGINNWINRRTALAQLSAATMLAAGHAKAQRADPSLAEIKTTDLGRKTYMLEGQGGNILVVVGDDGIIMVDAELAPLHDKISAAITDNSNLPIKYLVDTHFHGEQTGGNAPFHRDGAIIVAQDNVRVRLLAGTTNGLNYNKSPPASADAIPTETYVGGTKTVAVRGREALLTHATNAHTDGDSWIYLADADVIFTGDLFYNNGRYPMIDYANGGDIRGMVRANEAFLKLAKPGTKIASSRGSAVAGRAEVMAFRDMLAKARDRMAEIVRKGMSEEEAIAAKPFADLDAQWAGSERDAVNFVRVAYNSFKRA